MNKEEKRNALIFSVIIGLGVAYYFWRKKKRKDTSQKELKQAEISNDSERIKVIQKYIRVACKKDVPITGVYDENTKMLASKCIGLPKDGVITEESYGRAYRMLQSANLLPQ